MNPNPPAEPPESQIERPQAAPAPSPASTTASSPVLTTASPPASTPVATPRRDWFGVVLRVSAVVILIGAAWIGNRHLLLIEQHLERQAERERQKAKQRALRRVERIESDILELEQQREAAGWEMSAPEVASDPEGLVSLEAQRSELQTQIDSLYQEWERLADELAAIEDANPV